MKRWHWLIVCSLASTSLPSTAEVVRAVPNGFEISIQVEVPVSRAEAYEQFLNVGQWWDPDHSWFGDASGFSLEPKPGGCFCERDGQRAALHMTVTFVDPGKRLSMVGGLGPLQGLGLYGAMSFTFEDTDDGSRITHAYRVTGYYPDGLQTLAPIVDRVQQGQVNRLAARLKGTL